MDSVFKELLNEAGDTTRYLSLSLDDRINCRGLIKAHGVWWTIIGDFLWKS